MSNSCPELASLLAHRFEYSTWTEEDSITVGAGPSTGAARNKVISPTHLFSAEGGGLVLQLRSERGQDVLGQFPLLWRSLGRLGVDLMHQSLTIVEHL